MHIKLSLIITCFNEESYISHALESIIYQNHDFKYEIVIIDDCSTDDTAKVIKYYISKYPNIIKYFKNDKNYENAYSFWKGLDLSNGEYFHVLYGDDFFTNYDKLRKQINFLDKNNDFVAVAHNSIRCNEHDQSIIIERSIKKINNITTEYSYHEYLEKKTYAHTSTYMYRNIFLNSKIPDNLRGFRGDDPRTLIFLKYSGKKIKFLNLIGSVYNITNKGIWTSADPIKKCNITILIFENYKNLIAENPIEEKFCQKIIKKSEVRISNYHNGNSNNNIDKREMTSVDFIKNLYILTSQIIGYTHPNNRREIFKKIHCLSFIDELCEAFGRYYMVSKKYTIENDDYDESKIIILTGGFLSDKSGGIIIEISNLVKTYHDLGKNVYLLSSEIVDTNPEIITKHFPVNSNKFFFEKIKEKNLASSAQKLIDRIYDLKACKLYPFISHNDVVSNCALQKGIAKKIIIDYVFDHGTSLGITNSSIDHIIVKSSGQYQALLHKIPKSKLIYIPPYIKDEAHKNLYIPKTNKNLTTACAATRNYKIESDSNNKYCQIIPQIMKATGGKHYHYGPLSPEYKSTLLENLRSLDIHPTNFVHIEWCDNVAKDLVKKGCDLYMQSFPIAGALLPIQVMQYGIPIIGYNSTDNFLLYETDFLSKETIFWSNIEDLLYNISQLTKVKLIKLSKISRSFYENRHDYKKMHLRFINQEGFEIEDKELSPSPKTLLIDILETNNIVFDSIINSQNTTTSKSSAAYSFFHFFKRCIKKIISFCR
ncbi:MAG: glycosyltransferase family A protein [Rickettsiaceae bacterium]|nr:glycosyltransferase family A protein [Rickettsiaceae bacterium]